MNLELYIELRNELEPKWEEADKLVKSFVNPTTGLIRDIKDENYRKAKAQYDLVFNQIRTLNKHTSNKIKREYAMNKRVKK